MVYCLPRFWSIRIIDVFTGYNGSAECRGQNVVNSLMP